MIAATLAVLVATRALPAELADRDVWQERVFWLAWLLALVHAAYRSAPVQRARIAPAWREQCWAVCALSLGAAILNWITTGDHLLHTISTGYWPVAGFDLALLSTALIASLAATRLGRREAASALDQSATIDDASSMVATNEVAHG
jgi:hypothetical protein